jgi:serine/threonine-protein kinase HipA
MSVDALTVWMDGVETPAGALIRGVHSESSFTYEPAYLAARGALPLSLALPLQAEPFGDAAARAFFANLLPENRQLQRVMEREGLARDDVVGLLHHLGADCAGSVSCLPVGDPPVKTPGDLAADYQPLSDRELAHIVRRLQEDRRLPAEMRDPSPVAGVQSKIALTRLPDGGFALPREGVRAPTTHIIKVPAKRDSRDAKREEAAAVLAAAVGLEVSIPTALSIDGVDALLIERFDRLVEGGTVRRIHQEDFAQALGLPSELKYQRNGRPGRWFDAESATEVLDATRSPDAARLAFLTATLFNLCIGNTDNHAKNHALLYDAAGPPRLAPLYDLLPIRLSAGFTHELAFRIGDATHFDDMSGDDLRSFFRTMGVADEDLSLVVAEVVKPLIEGLERASPSLRSAGLKSFDDLLGREMEALAEKLTMTTAVEPRDYFPADGI